MTLLVGACLYDWDAYDPRSWTGTTGTGGSTAGGGGAGGGAGGAAAGAGGVAGGAATGGEAGSGGAGYCGDGSLLASEQCDDGNVVPLDGCDSGCLVECEGGLFNDVTHHCYRVSTASSGWQVAHSACLALGPGYDLAAISSVAEWDWLISQSQVLSATGVAGLYIGGTDALVEGQFVWTNGEPWGYDGWHTGEPNDYQTGEDYVEMNRTSNQYGLNDTNGQQLQRYLCELTPAGSNP